jgi:hypothetical protein
MKTIIEWYSLLPEPLKSQAFENAINCNQVDIFNVEVSSMYNAIDRGFIWDSTPQRSDYWLRITEQWDDDTNTLRIPLTFSSSMRTMLLSMRHDSKVANALLRDNLTHTTFANYITMRGELCSYLPNGREHTLNENGKWARNGRQDMKVAKMAKNLLTELAIINEDIDAVELEKFSNLVKSYISVLGDEDGEGKKIVFDVINGRKIYDAYLVDNYSKILGTDTNLFNSCMRHEECQSYLDIYVDNVEVVSMLVANDCNGKVLGRAILWTMHDGKKAMDTIYAHESLTASFIQWAHDNNYFYKSRQSCHHSDFDKHLTDGHIYLPCVILKKYEYNEYPYMDTLSILEDNQLRTEYNTNEYRILKSTDGGYEDCNRNVYDVYNQCDIDEDDARYVDYTRPNGQSINGYVSVDDLVDISHGGWVLSRDCVEVDGEDYLRSDEDICHVDSRNEWHLIDNCVSDYNGDMIHEDDSVELCGDVYSNEHAHEDDATRCIIDGEYYLNEDMIKVDGGMIYKENIEHYKLILNTINTKNNATKIA